MLAKREVVEKLGKKHTRSGENRFRKWNFFRAIRMNDAKTNPSVSVFSSFAEHCYIITLLGIQVDFTFAQISKTRNVSDGLLHFKI